MEGDISFLPYQPPFAELDHAQAGSGSPSSSNFVSGYPYDLIDDIPVTSFKPVSTDSYARGGAVHYSGARSPGSYPTIDRAYYYKVDSAQVITQSHWGENYDVYFQTTVKSNEASVWGYNYAGEGYEFKFLASTSKASLEAYGGEKHIIISTEDLTEDQPFAKFREVVDGEMQKRLFLCTEPTDGGDPQCEELADPIVKDIYASNLYSHKPCTNDSETYLSLANSYFQVKAGGAADKISVDTVNIWAVTGGTASAKFSADGLTAVDGTSYTGSVMANSIGVASNDGNSDLSDTYLHINRTSGGYATFNGEGWLEVKNADGDMSRLGALLKLESGNFSGSTELWAGALKLFSSSSNAIALQYVDSSAEINMNSSLGSVRIATADLGGSNTSAAFRQVKVCVNGEDKIAWVLMTVPE